MVRFGLHPATKPHGRLPRIGEDSIMTQYNRKKEKKLEEPGIFLGFRPDFFWLFWEYAGASGQATEKNGKNRNRPPDAELSQAYIIIQRGENATSFINCIGIVAALGAGDGRPSGGMAEDFSGRRWTNAPEKSMLKGSVRGRGVRPR